MGEEEFNVRLILNMRENEREEHRGERGCLERDRMI
jgi:hypothetical protein